MFPRPRSTPLSADGNHSRKHHGRPPPLAERRVQSQEPTPLRAGDPKPGAPEANEGNTVVHAHSESPAVPPRGASLYASFIRKRFTVSSSGPTVAQSACFSFLLFVRLVCLAPLPPALPLLLESLFFQIYQLKWPSSAPPALLLLQACCRGYAARAMPQGLCCVGLSRRGYAAGIMDHG